MTSPSIYTSRNNSLSHLLRLILSLRQVSSDWCNGLRLLHCEGYCLYRPKLAQEMMLAVKAAGAIVSMDLASFEVRSIEIHQTNLSESVHLSILSARAQPSQLVVIVSMGWP